MITIVLRRVWSWRRWFINAADVPLPPIDEAIYRILFAKPFVNSSLLAAAADGIARGTGEKIEQPVCPSV